MKQHDDMSLLDYFDRVSIIHLKNRTDRYRALVGELGRLGIEMTHPKVTIPDAPMPPDANGFTNKGVYGSFLSHLDILQTAQRDGIESVWVLEDDAIFSHRFVRKQNELARFLAQNPWDICYFGHSLTSELGTLDVGLPRYSGPFYWAHCYAVHARVLPRLIAFLEENRDSPPDHPRGGKMYVDAAYTHFRKYNPDVVSRVANPVLSVQRGTPSSLGHGKWYDENPVTRPAVGLIRALRDECWRWTGWTFGGAAPRSEP